MPLDASPDAAHVAIWRVGQPWAAIISSTGRGSLASFFSDSTTRWCSSTSRNRFPRFYIRSDDALVATRALEALVHFVVLAEQLPGVRAIGVELFGLLALAIRAPVDSWSTLVDFRV